MFFSKKSVYTGKRVPDELDKSGTAFCTDAPGRPLDVVAERQVFSKWRQAKWTSLPSLVWYSDSD